MYELEFFRKSYPRLWRQIKDFTPYIEEATLVGDKLMWLALKMTSRQVRDACVTMNPEVYRTEHNAGGDALSDIRTELGADYWKNSLKAGKVIIIRSYSKE